MLAQARHERRDVGLLDFFRREKRTAAPPPPALPDSTKKEAAERRHVIEQLRAHPTLKAALDKNKMAPSTPEQLAREMGISGTANFRGDILSESNAKLIHQLAFGQPGSRTWGEYETILFTDPCVAMGVEHNASQLRDAQVDVTPASKESAPELWTQMMKVGDRTLSLAEAQAEFVKWNLTKALEPGWPELVQQIVRGVLVPGFSLHERRTQRIEHPLLPLGSGYKLAELKQLLPRSIHPNGWLEAEGDLVAVNQEGPSNDSSGKWTSLSLPADRLLLVTHNRDGNNYLGRSAFRSVWYLCKIREELAKLIGIALTREGAGIPIGFCADKGTELSPDQRAKLEELLANLVFHENASAVMPAGWDIKWLFSPGANKGHVVDAYNSLGLIVLQVVEAQQLALGVNGTGSRAVGEVHSTSSDAFVLGLMGSIAGVINGVGERPYTGIARQIVQWNWGAQKAYPEVSFTPKQAKLDPTAYANGIKSGRDAKVITVWTIDDENVYRGHYGHRKVTQDEWDEAETKATEAAQQMREQMQQQPAEGGGPPRPPGANVPPKVPPKMARRGAQASEFVPRRALRPAEVHCAWADMAKYLDGAKERFERGAKPLVMAMLSKLLPAVRAAAADGKIDHADIAALSFDTVDLDAFVGKWLDGVRREGYRQVAGEKHRASLAGTPRTGADEKDPPPPDPSPPDVPPQQQLLEVQRQQLVRRIEARLRTELEDDAIGVDVTDGDPAEIVTDVMTRQAKGKQLQGDAGGVTTRAFNLGREEFAEQYADQIEGVEISALLDENTCDYCDSMDGTELDFGSANEEALTPPLRQCEGRGKCRCLKVFTFAAPGNAG